MATDYEMVFKKNRHALGDPSKEFVKFFDSYDRNHASILDLGCGQGRDALFIARLGHRVIGIDHSPSGIRDLLEDAENEGLVIEAQVADIRSYSPDCAYDIVIIDRTLHMLDPEDQLSVLQTMLDAVCADGFMLIADESSNIPAFEKVFDASKPVWTPIFKRRGYLFVQRN